ncbi:hypothetical protein [Aeromicrobium wangtongii]|uniref:PH domain-containing protein n=1 Tax=Aeromicrobium wangtongii TaxID=2969247 RepID=A0ABY5MDP4_9ACTN|nr:hypothetical protein [Aeromicrobium wangtongii]MCD9197791.1 hypothetical protein [Aeromicrobium wangtongii]UUP15273.1 hypothetical protein NQV15_08170 [Aeromicrobium wangtongii]
MFFGRKQHDHPPRVATFRPSRASQQQESTRLRYIAVLPSLLLIGGATAGVLSADNRRDALLVYGGLLAVAGLIAAPIVVVLLVRNRMLIANSSFTVTPETVTHVDRRGRSTTFDRSDPTLTSLLSWVEPTVLPYGGVFPPKTLQLFIADSTHQVRVAGSDWETGDLRVVAEAANGHVAHDLSTARQVNDAIPGAMSFRELRPLTFALAVGFGSVAFLLMVIVLIAFLQS